jgi:16S rRNA (adenine1518-N6/adenine1519-N6)-dimethyltransferase
MSPGAPPPLRDVIERYGLAAKKSLGQHFLLDPNITRKIARAAKAGNEDAILEIGPGPGGLTRALLETGARVFAIERDERCVHALKELQSHYPAQLVIAASDALAIDEAIVVHGAAPVKIVANLPYNISTELLVKWLKAGPALWRAMTLMFQKEVADRILAAPGSKTYGRLSVMAQAASVPSRAFDLPARAFTPPPKVASTVVSFAPAAARPRHLEALERVAKAAFGQRRKMLRTSLKETFGDALAGALAHAELKDSQRAETVSVAQFMRLAETLDEQIL